MNIFKLTLISLLCLFVFTGCIKKTVVTAGKIVEMAVLLPIAGVAYAVQQAKGEEDTKDKENEESKPSKDNSNQDVTTTQNNQTKKTNDIEQELEPSSTIAQVQVLKEEDIIKTTEE